MRIFFSFLILALLLPAAAHARSEGIAAVVNQDIISMADLNDRLRMIVISSGLPPTKEIQEKMMHQVLNELMEEQLKMQETKRREITVTDEEVNAGFAQIAQQNKLTLDQFKQAIQHDGINPATIERQIRAQIGWSKVIQETMRPKITVSDTDIDDYIARFDAAKGKNEYNVAEIFLPVGEGAPEADAQQLANRLVKEMTEGKAPFPKVAQQFSSAPGASQGGSLGWVQQGQLDPALEQALAGMQKDGISQPVRTNDGYHILYLRDMRTVSEEATPDRDKIYSIIGIQRLERMQARELLDLKTTAFIETRVDS